LGLGHLDAELCSSRTDRRLIDEQAERDLLDPLVVGGVLRREGLSLAVGFLVEVLDRRLEVLLSDLVAGNGLDGLVAAARAADDFGDRSGEDGDGEHGRNHDQASHSGASCRNRSAGGVVACSRR
jgi:hypothetical protein